MRHAHRGLRAPRLAGLEPRLERLWLRLERLWLRLERLWLRLAGLEPRLERLWLRLERLWLQLEGLAPGGRALGHGEADPLVEPERPGRVVRVNAQDPELHPSLAQ